MPLAPASQSIFVQSLTHAQQNKDPYVPRSNTYALSVLRAATATTTYLDFEITDATGRTLVPRTQVHLQPTPTPTALAESTDSPQLSRRLLSNSPTTTTTPKGKRSGHPAPNFRGRRKGKGGIMGSGVGARGGGRYGGGTGGFRAASGGVKGYGYS